MNPRRRLFQQLLISCLIVCFATSSRAQLFYTGSGARKTGSSVQIGALVSYAMPRNAFAMEFGRAPGFELFFQLRSGQGEGPFNSRLGIFYTSFRPRLDTFPTYMVGGADYKVFPGYVTYKNLSMKGLCIDQSYSVLRVKGLRVDLGFGLGVGVYNLEYTAEYKTLLNTSAQIEDLFAALRPKLGAGYRLNRHLEIYGEYKHVLATSQDWARHFGQSTAGIGMNITFNPDDSHENY